LEFAGFAVAALVWFGFWAVPVNADPASEKKIVDVREMPIKERAELGEELIFGRVGGSQIQGAIGKAQCPLCHGFQKGFLSERAPNLYGITERAKERLKDPRYHMNKPNERDTVQNEAFPGSGTATNALEYLAESDVCHSCYVVAGFGIRGSNDRDSAAPSSYEQPISLSIDELIALTTWLYVHDGKEPPSPQEIENAYRKFIPASDWPLPIREPGIYPGAYPPPSPPGVILTGQERIDYLFAKAVCGACHTIPGIRWATGRLGPKLVMKTTGPKRLEDPRYKGKATNVREYIIESIVDHSIYVVDGYSDLPLEHYRNEFSADALDKMTDYLSQLEEGNETPKAQ
jgi:hypothetical protein